MSRTVIIFGEFEKLDRLGFPTGKKEILANCAFNEDTGKVVIVGLESPEYYRTHCGMYFCRDINEFVLP